MKQEKRFLVDVGIQDLYYPILVNSRNEPDGQHTIANISIEARIMSGFEARWIDKFIHILHDHKGRIGTASLRQNILDYLKDLSASYVHITFAYPFFVEKEAPVSGEKNLVKYDCRYSVTATASAQEPEGQFNIQVPVITTYPAASSETPAGLFGQLSIVDLQLDTRELINPEDMVELVDRHALAPTYSYLSGEDQKHLIKQIHDREKYSVVMVDEIKRELASREDIPGSSIRCYNHGMLHGFSTMISTENSPWVPYSGYSDDY